MQDILVPSLFSGIILAFLYANLFLAASFINLKKAGPSPSKVNPKFIFISVMLTYPVCAGLSFVIGSIFVLIDNTLIYSLLIIVLGLIFMFGSFLIFKILKIVLVGYIGFLILNLWLLPFMINA
ncbi:MAG: hypothetical protein CL730_02695 [Chloroflexi bacterium]|nr:hypothetical protein [Chloroflexota bacterium]